MVMENRLLGRMVLLHVKQGDDRQFLFEAPSSQNIDLLIRELVSITNFQCRILRLVEEAEQLASHGPAKPCDNDCDTDSDDETVSSSVKICKERGPFYKKDPSGRRTGEACDPTLAEVLIKALSEAKTCISVNQVLHKVPLTSSMLKEAVQNIKGAVMICYPMGIPTHDPVQKLLLGTFDDKDTLDPLTAQLWWAGKELMRDKKLSDHVGKNDKTKIIVKLQEKGRGAPPREPPIDAETQKAMMAWYHKRQQEQKKLGEDEDDRYTNSEWANTRSLKAHFQGTSHIRYR